MMPKATWSQTWASVTPIVSPGSSPTWLDRVGDQLRRDHHSDIRVLAQPVEAQRGPDVKACYPHRFRNAGQYEGDHLLIDCYRCL